MNKWLIALAVALPVAACSPEPQHYEARMSTARTDASMVADWIIQGRNDFLVLDLRTPAEFAKGHLPGAVNLDPADLSKASVLRQLPTYKKLVFYGAEDRQPQLLQPVFARGLHVLTITGGYESWQHDVVSPLGEKNLPKDVKRIAVSKYFRGESALGTPQPLKEVPAQQYIRQPSLPATRAAPLKLEGC